MILLNDFWLMKSMEKKIVLFKSFTNKDADELCNVNGYKSSASSAMHHKINENRCNVPLFFNEKSFQMFGAKMYGFRHLFCLVKLTKPAHR